MGGFRAFFYRNIRVILANINCSLCGLFEISVGAAALSAVLDVPVQYFGGLRLKLYGHFSLRSMCAAKLTTPMIYLPLMIAHSVMNRCLRSHIFPKEKKTLSLTEHCSIEVTIIELLCCFERRKHLLIITLSGSWFCRYHHFKNYSNYLWGFAVRTSSHSAIIQRGWVIMYFAYSAIIGRGWVIKA